MFVIGLELRVRESGFVGKRTRSFSSITAGH